MNDKDLTQKLLDEFFGSYSLPKNWKFEGEVFKDGPVAGPALKFKESDVSKGYIVGSSGQGASVSWSVSALPRIHASETEAKAEAERLAKLTPGKTYVVLEVKGRVTSNAVTWE